MNQVEPVGYNSLIDQYLDVMLKKNQSINLTRVTDYKEAQLLHIEDSLAVIEDLNKAPDGLYGDMGSGCGFPGVALAIASGRQTVLIDSVKKKMSAVQDLLDKLGLNQQITTSDIRLEELATLHPESFSVLSARALSSLPSLLELASPLLQMNGILLALKAQVHTHELEQAHAIEEKTGMKLSYIKEYYLSDNETYRSLYVFKKIHLPTITLPRKIGLAQKRPLK